MDNDEKLDLRNQQLLLGDAPARERSHKNIALIKNSAFWHGLARCVDMFRFASTVTNLCPCLAGMGTHRIKNFLEPLAVASNITQADSAHVDVVLITFAFLYI